MSPKSESPSGSVIEKPLEDDKFIEGDAGDGTRNVDQYLHGFKLYLVVLATVLCFFLVGLDQTIVSVILTEVGNKFNALSKVGWLVSGFMLPIAVLGANWGQISIIFGRKWTMMVSIIIFELGSLVCAVSNNMNTLIGGRVLAGIGAGGIQTLSMIVVAEVASPNIRPFVTASVGLCMGISLVLGPILGGLLSEVTWRWCFYINLPIGGLSMILFLLTFRPPTPKFDLRRKFVLIDYLGTFLVASGLVLFLIGLTFGSTKEYPWKSAAVIVNIVLGFLFFVAFCIWNFKFSKHPLIPPKVVTTYSSLMFSANLGFMFGNVIGLILYISIYLENVWGYSPLKTGVHTLPLVLSTSLFNIVGGIVVGKTRHIKPVVIIGTTITLVGTGLVCLLDEKSSTAKKIGYLILPGVGAGLSMQSIMAGTQLGPPKVEGGLIMTAAFGMFTRGVNSSLITVLCDVVYTSVLGKKMKSAFSNLSDPTLLQEFSKYDVSDIATNTEIISSLSPEAKLFIRKVISDSVRVVFYFIFAFSGPLFLISLFLPAIRVPKKSQVITKAERDAMDQEKLEKLAKEELDKKEEGNLNDEESHKDVENQKEVENLESASDLTPKDQSSDKIQQQV